MERIDPIQIYKERLNLISYFYSYSFKNEELLKSPLLKVGILGTGKTYLDKLFVIEETNPMVLFIKNNIYKDKDIPYRRTIYSIVRTKLKYVHYDSGIIFSDLLDYAHIDRNEIRRFFKFQYEGKIYENIDEISSIDNEYKLKTNILNIHDNSIFPNNMYLYNYYLKTEALNNVGYYIPESSCINLHPILFIPKLFGLLPGSFEPKNIYFDQMLAHFGNLEFTFQYLFEIKCLQYTSEKNSKKYIDNSIKNIIVNVSGASDKYYLNQQNRMSIGHFICEVLYEFFFKLN